MAADARPRARSRAAHRLGRRQHARERALRLERRTCDRRGRVTACISIRRREVAARRATCPTTAAARVRDVRFFVLPRMSPDGAETVITKGRYVRSVPRDDRPAQGHAHWRGEDVDGDGLALLMRVQDAGGEMVESAEIPGLMLPRTIDDPPPYYKIYPEGVIENFDGHTVPSPYFLSDNQTDLNRNCPYYFAPDSKQEGAGAYPLSEVESRAVVEFTTRHPDIFLWLNLHTFGGVFIRPLGDKPDTKMNPEDLALYRQLGAWAEELTELSDGVRRRGVPVRAGYAAARRSHRLRVSPARRGGVRRRAVGPVQAGRARAQEALRGQLHARHARRHGEDRPVGPRPQRRPHAAAVAQGDASAARRRGSGRHRSARGHVESAAREDAGGLPRAVGALPAHGVASRRPSRSNRWT